MVRTWLQRAKGEPGGWTDVAEADFADEAVSVAVSHSAVNFKDALALTGRSPIFRRFPMVPGVDLAGTVISDRSGRLPAGTPVVATGHGLGEIHWGGYAGIARLQPDWAVALPAGITPVMAAAMGTAGVTAAMALNALEDYGIAPGDGPVLVTGPAGGVGGQAVALLAAAGYSVVAATGRPAEADYLRAIGAGEIIDRRELDGEPRPLAKERWRAAVDVVGGRILANVLSSISYGGAVAACGLAQSMDLPGSVAPFILRGVAMLGIGSVTPPAAVRRRAWDRLARDLPAEKLKLMTVPRFFDEVDAVATELLDQTIRGRVVLSWR